MGKLPTLWTGQILTIIGGPPTTVLGGSKPPLSYTERQ